MAWQIQGSVSVGWSVCGREWMVIRQPSVVGGDGELEVAAAGLVQDEGGVEGEFVEVGGAGVVSGVQGQVDQGGAGQQDGAGDGVVGEPGVGLQADSGRSGRWSLVSASCDGGAEQGVVGCVARPRSVASAS